MPTAPIGSWIRLRQLYINWLAAQNLRGMDKSGFFTVIFLLLMFLDRSSAWNLWRLIEVAPMENSTAKHISPLPGPVSGGNQSNTSSVDGYKPKKEKTLDPQPSKDSPMVDPKAPKNTDNKTAASASPANDKQQIEKGKNSEEKGNNQNKTRSGSVSSESCNDPTKTCVKGAMVACIQGLDNGSKNIVILVQNKGESTLKVKVTQPTVKITMGRHEVLGHQTGKIDIPVTIDQSMKIVLNAGNGDCEVHTGPPLSGGDFLQQLQFYYKQLTPIYGAYVFFLIALIVGGTWSCCKLRKRRRPKGIPYQELEMGLPESASAANVDTAEGWDKGWDDDWDEENAVKSPVGHHVGSISANGLTAWSSNRDGWEKDWDD